MLQDSRGVSGALLGILVLALLGATGLLIALILPGRGIVQRALAAYVVVWAARTKRRGAWYVVTLVAAQVAVAAAMVLLALPGALQAAHVAVGAGVWAGLVLVGL